MKSIKYPKTPQFSSLVQNIKHVARFVGVDEVTNEPVYDNLRLLPIISFKGTVKLHGTNAGISGNRKDGIWYQKRSGATNNGHYGFCSTMNSLSLETWFLQILDVNNIKDETLTIYGEWAGEGVQKGVGISNFPKCFYIFGAKVTPEEGDSYWVDSEYITHPSDYIKNVSEFPIYDIVIDFNFPQKSLENLMKITEEVENSCPVSKQLGKEGIGEGIVWSGFYKGVRYIFKTKGEKHSVSKVKTLKSVDIKLISNANVFAETHVTENRIRQGLHELELSYHRKNTGDLLRWIVNDIYSEEQFDGDRNITNKAISQHARVIFFKMIDDNL